MARTKVAERASAEDIQRRWQCVERFAPPEKDADALLAADVALHLTLAEEPGT
jgi:hypothetical protein